MQAVEPDFDQSEFSTGLNHKRVILLGGVRWYPVLSNHMWQSKL